MQSLLGEEEALVLFLDMLDMKPLPEESFVWVVTKSDVRWVRSDLGTPALTREVAALRCGLDAALWLDASPWPETTSEQKRAKAEQAARRQRCLDLLRTEPKYYGDGRPRSDTLPFDHARAHKLYSALFGEVQDLIKGKHLLIVPSGPLTQLPFQVLVTKPPTSRRSSCDRLARPRARHHRLACRLVLEGPAPRRQAQHRTKADDRLRQSAARRARRALREPCQARPREATLPGRLSQRVAALVELRGGVAAVETRGGLADVSLIKVQVPLPETADELCAVAAGREGGCPATSASAPRRRSARSSGSARAASWRSIAWCTSPPTAFSLGSSTAPTSRA